MTPLATPDSLAALVVISLLMSIITMATTIWRHVRAPARMPPAEEEAARTYATKRELGCLRAEWQTECNRRHSEQKETSREIFNVIRESENRHNEWQRAMSQLIGRLESIVAEFGKRLDDYHVLVSKGGRNAPRG